MDGILRGDYNGNTHGCNIIIEHGTDIIVNPGHFENGEVQFWGLQTRIRHDTGMDIFSEGDPKEILWSGSCL